jgi:hypothetical protein
VRGVVRPSGRPVAGDLVKLKRALDEVEAILDSVDPPPLPAVIVVGVFMDDSREDVLKYTDQLWERFPKSLVITVEAVCPRPPGLKAAWTSPRAWLDYETQEREVANLTPDLKGQSTATTYWNPPFPEEALDVGPGAEHRARIAVARERWARQQVKDGTELPEWMLNSPV